MAMVLVLEMLLLPVAPPAPIPARSMCDKSAFCIPIILFPVCVSL